jgi:phosphopantothenoylcysteine decarboxylase/phosphopantothenate--cysteine ligase
MDLDMLQHPATKNNIQKLISYGNSILEPGFGELASGLIGQGRMAEPEEIVAHLENHFNEHLLLKGKRALVSAGPTYEAIDPVRFIGNNSSGKMGFAIAEILAERGAHVTLVTGPTTLQTNHSGINLHRVTSSDEMYHQCISAFPSSEITVLSAAVADYKPITVAEQKIKKKEDSFTIALTKTKDIAAELGKQKKSGQIIVGFALETEDEIANAEKKIKAKNFDFIVLNSLRDQGAGFGHNTNKVTLIDQSLIKTEFNLKTKKEVAIDIVNAICSLSNANA